MHFLVYSWALVIFLCSLSISSSKFFRRDKGFSNFITRRIPPSMLFVCPLLGDTGSLRRMLYMWSWGYEPTVARYSGLKVDTILLQIYILFLNSFL